MKNWLFGLITLVCVCTLWLFQDAITVNIPWWDDFHGIMLPVHDLFTDKSLSHKFQNFFSLNNEHRVVNDRIFTLLVYLIKGKFELKTIALLGFFNLIGIFLILYKVFKSESVSNWAILPIVFLIFHAQYYESLQSIMVPFQNFSVILYMLLSLYFLIYKNSFLWGFFFALAAIFSHGNGILVFILGALVLLTNQKYKQTGVWILLSAITVFVYFIGYSKPEWTTEAVVSPLEDPIAAIAYAFEFLGSYSLNLVEISTGLANSSAKQLVPQALGLLVITFFIYIVFKKYPLKNLKNSLQHLKNNPSDQFFLAMAAFFLATGIIMGLTRTGFPVLSRYTINSSFFLIAVWGFYTTNNRFKGEKAVSILTFTALLLSYYHATAKGLYVKSNTITDAINYQTNGTWVNGYSDSSHVSRVNPLLIEPLESGAYTFPKSDLDGFREWTTEVNNEVLDFSIVDNYLMISGGMSPQTTETYFTLESQAYQFIFPTRMIRANPKDLVLYQKYYTSSYYSAFPIGVIPTGKYSIFKIEKQNGVYKKYRLGRILDTKGLIL
jgi:hypothetical protein